MKNTKKRLLTSVLSIALAATLSTAMSSCTGGAENQDGTKAEVPELTAPEDTRSLDGALSLIDDAQNLLDTAFSSVEVTPAEQFTVELDKNGDASITGYNGEDIVVVIPDEINGAPVTEIAPEAFKGLTALRAVCIPDSVTAIGAGAFKGCNSLTTLKLPFNAAIYEIEKAVAAETSVEDGNTSETVTVDGYFGYIFGALSYKINAASVPANLKTVIFTGAAEEIPDYAFYDCNDIIQISLPDGIEKIGDFAFSGCSSLAMIGIGDSAKEIGSYAFDNCSSLLDITLPATVESIGLGAFQGCGSLVTMTLPFVGGSHDENLYFGYIFGAESYTLAPGFFPASLIRVTVLEGCTSIGDNAFNNCRTVREIVLPEGITKIGYRAFRNCVLLRSISLPSSTKSIGDSAFLGCVSLNGVSLGDGLEDMGVQIFMHCISLESISLPESITSVPASTFDGCKALESIEWSEDIESIGKNAFRGCTSLTTFPDIADHVVIEEGNEPFGRVMKAYDQ